MAKSKKRVASEVVVRRQRRTSEEIIEDLQREIERVRLRARAKELQSSPAVKSACAAVRALDRALEHAAEENNTTLRHFLADARKPLGAYLEKQGVQLSKPNLPKGRKPASSP